jgi:hypothetical protein
MCAVVQIVAWQVIAVISIAANGFCFTREV